MEKYPSGVCAEINCRLLCRTTAECGREGYVPGIVNVCVSAVLDGLVKLHVIVAVDDIFVQLILYAVPAVIGVVKYCVVPAV